MRSTAAAKGDRTKAGWSGGDHHRQRGSGHTGAGQHPNRKAKEQTAAEQRLDRTGAEHTGVDGATQRHKRGSSACAKGNHAKPCAAEGRGQRLHRTGAEHTGAERYGSEAAVLKREAAAFLHRRKPQHLRAPCGGGRK